ncbi:MAG: alpha/beta hydrolase [Phycisphaerales bacterium]
MDGLLGVAILLLIALGVLGVLLAAMIVHGATHPPRHTAGYALAHSLACDPGELDLRYESWTLDRPDGAKLPVWEVQTGKPRREDHDITIVFLHGWGRSRIDLLARMRPWDELCDRLVLYDLRGHGESTGGASRLGCDEGADLIALLERLGEARFILVGNSMGAVIAIAAAAANDAVRRRIVGLIAYGPYIDFHTSLRHRLRAAGLPTRPLTDLAMLWFRLRGLRQRRTLEDAARLHCPLLVIHGGEDRISPAHHAEMIVARAPDAVLHTAQGAGHSDAHAVDVQSHDAAVRAFVERVRVVGTFGHD